MPHDSSRPPGAAPDPRQLMEIYRRWSILQLQSFSRVWWRNWTWPHAALLAGTFALLLAAPLDWALLGLPWAWQFPSPGIAGGVLAGCFGALWAVDAFLIGRLLARHDPAPGRSAVFRSLRRIAGGVPLFGLFLLPLLRSGDGPGTPGTAAGVAVEVSPRPWGEAWERRLRRFEGSVVWLLWIFPGNLVAWLVLVGELTVDRPPTGGRWWIAVGLTGILHLLAIFVLASYGRAEAVRRDGIGRGLWRLLPLVGLLPAFVALLPAFLGMSAADGTGASKGVVFAAFGSGGSARRLPLWAATRERLGRSRRQQRWWLRWTAAARGRDAPRGRAAERLGSLLRLGLLVAACQWGGLGWWAAGAGGAAGPTAVGLPPLLAVLGLGALAAVGLLLAASVRRSLAFLAGGQPPPGGALRSLAATSLVAFVAAALGFLLRIGGPAQLALGLGLAASAALLLGGFRYIVSIPFRHAPPPLGWLAVGAALGLLGIGMLLDARTAERAAVVLLWAAASSPLWGAAALAMAIAPLLARSGRRPGRRALLLAGALLPTGGLAVPLWRLAADAGWLAGGSPTADGREPT